MGGTRPVGRPPLRRAVRTHSRVLAEGSCSGRECGDGDRMPRRGKGLAARAREAGLPGAPAGMASRGPQDAPGIPAHMALLPHTHPQHQDPDRGGGPPVITFPMMLPTSCRKNHRKPMSSGALCPCDTGRRGPEAGRRVVRPGRLCGGPASGGSLCAHLSAADPGPPLTDGQPCRGAGQLLPANGQVAAGAQRRGEPCAKPAVSGIPLHFTV